MRINEEGWNAGNFALWILFPYFLTSVGVKVVCLLSRKKMWINEESWNAGNFALWMLFPYFLFS
jgi:hypothetical protein